MDELIVNTADIAWERAEGYSAGTEWKVLRRSDQGDPRTVLLKLPPGFNMTAHSHLCSEHHYLLEGQYESQGKQFAAGVYRVIPKHIRHGPFTSANGAVVLLVWEE